MGRLFNRRFDGLGEGGELGVRAGPTAELEQISLEVIYDELACGADPAGIRRARLLQAYELLFWNSLPR